MRGLLCWKRPHHLMPVNWSACQSILQVLDNRTLCEALPVLQLCRSSDILLDLCLDSRCLLLFLLLLILLVHNHILEKLIWRHRLWRLFWISFGDCGLSRMKRRTFIWRCDLTFERSSHNTEELICGRFESCAAYSMNRAQSTSWTALDATTCSAFPFVKRLRITQRLFSHWQLLFSYFCIYLENLVWFFVGRAVILLTATLFLTDATNEVIFLFFVIDASVLNHAMIVFEFLVDAHHSRLCNLLHRCGHSWCPTFKSICRVLAFKGLRARLKRASANRSWSSGHSIEQKITPSEVTDRVELLGRCWSAAWSVHRRWPKSGLGQLS